MARIISLIVLVVFVILVGAIFFWVMAGFILPLFLAVLLAVIFKPLHERFTRKLQGRDRIAAIITTIVILVIVLVPLIAIIFEAVSEAVELVQGAELEFNTAAVGELVEVLNQRLGLELPAEMIEENVESLARELLEPIARRTPAFVGSFLLGLIVMVVALYYFLADGHDMIATITRLLPLDSRYQEQLLSEFERVSRAVVSATLLSALAQGILAGIGFTIVGLGSVFMLMMLTMVGSMIPFVGAASVWVSCTLYLLFVQKNILWGLVLAVYGATIISAVDNIIKPMILHGQSKLHPLLALLSVLGGVQALGPLGIFVGPMAVAFLQAGLTMLNLEIGTLDNSTETSNLAG